MDSASYILVKKNLAGPMGWAAARSGASYPSRRAEPANTEGTPGSRKNGEPREVSLSTLPCNPQRTP